MPDIDPFEPWRPKQDPPAEPAEPERDVNSARPWRPPAPGGPERQEPDVSPLAQPRSVTWPAPEKRSPSQVALLWLTIAVVVGGVVALIYLGWPHVSRIGATGAALWLGGLTGLRLANRAPVNTRLALAAVGVVGAAVAWAFVPTTGGISLVEAHRLRAEAEALPVGDLDHYRATARQRQELVSEYPTFRDDIRAAEERWAEQTVAVVIKEADDLSVSKKAPAALDRLTALEQALGPPTRSSVGVSVQGARQRIVRSWLDDEEAGLGGLIKEKKFIVLPAACDRVLEKLRPEARLAGLEDELIQRVREVRRQGVRGRIAAAKDELTRLLTGKDHAGVARQGAALVRSLSDGAAEVGLGAELTEPLQEIRKQSLTAWSEQAARQLADLLAKGKLIEVAREGARSMNELNDEATALANPQALERLREVRGKALRARLEAARREALALVKQDRNQAAEQLGLRTEEELGDEARAVGAESEVVAFRKTCEVFGDLARKAKKSDPK